MRYIILFILSIYAFALDIQKPKNYKGYENIKNWVMSEKLDGIRAIWNGKQFLTRNGKKIYAPKWFIKDFPPFKLDGELWTKRTDFENIQNIVMDKTPSKDWKQITYNIFEVPNQEGDFLKRLNKLKQWLEKNPNKYIKIIPQIPIKNRGHLYEFLDSLLKKGAEGLIIRDPKKDFHTGRSSHILKVKKAKDMEGEVIGINISKKTKLLKSLKLKLGNGTTFNLGSGFTKVQREKPPKIGTIVTFKYFGFTKKGIPKFASFLHERKD